MESRILDPLDHLRAHAGNVPHAPLPSIRTLARLYRVSPVTVQKALRRLAQEGAVYALSRKGYFWGSGPASLPAIPPAMDRSEARLRQVEKDFLETFHTGELDPFLRAPPLKILAHRHRTSTRTMAKALSALVDRGALSREGRGYRLAARTRLRGRNVVALITRCDSGGRLLLDSDRELDFIKAAYQEAQAQRLELRILGYDGEGLLDREGGAADPREAGGNLLGFLVSTWLIPDVGKILDRLGPYRQPISIWWEHPAETVPRNRGKSGRITFFNQAFGEAPGILVAEHLISLGHERVLFISPFHQSSWSRLRLQGLCTRMDREPGGRVRALTSDKQASPWSLRRQAREELRARGRRPDPDDARISKQAGRNLEAEVRALLQGRPEDEAATAWVCVNDQVAEIAAKLAERAAGKAGGAAGKAAGKRPYLISFDNSALSYRLRIDSFAFNTQAMVRDMLFHLTRPSRKVLPQDTVIEIAGHVVRK